MKQNVHLYNSCKHLIAASKFLIDIDEEKRIKILDIAQSLLDQIKIDEVEMNKISDYEKKLDETIKEKV